MSGFIEEDEISIEVRATDPTVILDALPDAIDNDKERISAEVKVDIVSDLDEAVGSRDNASVSDSGDDEAAGNNSYVFIMKPSECINNFFSQNYVFLKEFSHTLTNYYYYYYYLIVYFFYLIFIFNKTRLFSQMVLK